MRLDVVGCGWMWMDVHFSMCPLDSPVKLISNFLQKSGYFGLVWPYSVGMDDETGCLLTKRQLKSVKFYHKLSPRMFKKWHGLAWVGMGWNGLAWAGMGILVSASRATLPMPNKNGLFFIKFLADWTEIMEVGYKMVQMVWWKCFVRFLAARFSTCGF